MRTNHFTEFILELGYRQTQLFLLTVTSNSNKMKESEEDISARAEEYVRKYIKGNVIDFSVEVEVVKSFIEGYKSCLAAQYQSVEGSKYTERDMIAFGVFLGSYQNLEIEEVLDIFNKESGISEKPNNHIESLEKKLMQ